MNRSQHPASVALPATALPDHVLTRQDSVETARSFLGADFPHLGRIVKIIEGSGVDTRHLVRPLSATLQDAGFGARNDLYMTTVKDLGERAAAQALANAGLQPRDVDLVITTSCTGIMIPSLDAWLIPKMGFRRSTKRLPITELGCAAGAVALSRAREFLQVYPGRNVLIIAAELCSLTYQPRDLDMQALVGGILFGDGVAACVVQGAERPGLRLQANDSFLFEDSWGYMGFDMRDTGLHLVLDKGIPNAVEKQIAPVLTGFLAEHGLKKEQVGFFGIHPGGRKVMDEIERVFGLDDQPLRASRDCLREVGNLSSASILVVLKNMIERYAPKDGAQGLLTAFGPGFSAEMLLASWHDA